MNADTTQPQEQGSTEELQAIHAHLPDLGGEWEMKRLGDIADIDPDNLPNNTDPDYEFNYISIEQVDSGQLLGFTEIFFRTAPSRARRVLRENDILMSTVRPNLMAHLFFRGQIANAVCSTGFAVIRSKSNVSDPGFLFAHLFGHVVNKQISKILAGSNYPAINTNDVRMIEIPCPPSVEEQRAIAEALSDVDGLIQSLNALIAKKRAIKQAAMQQLLTGKTRLPGFSGAWEAKTLGEVADIKSGATPSTQIGAYWNGSIPWCIPTDITATQGKYLLATERHITAEGLASCAASLLPIGALLLCSRATIGEIKIAAFPVCTNQGFKSLVCKDNISNEFLYYLLLTLKPQMMERAIGSTFLEIGKRDVASIELPIPTYTEQHVIAAILSDMDAEITALEQRRDKTRAIKQGMMQQLLTGRMRLPKPE